MIVAAAIFAVDMMFPLELAGTAPYFVAVFSAWRSPDKHDVWLLAGLVGVLSILGFFLTAPLAAYLPARAMMLFATIAVSALITQRNQAEMALRDARESADRAKSGKSRFFAVASHDLRQPVQALNLFVHSLSRKAKGDAEIGELVGNICMTSEVLSGLLNALLEISRLDSGMVDPEIEDFPIKAVLDDVSNIFAEQAHEKSIDLRVVTSSAIVNSDPALVQRIIYHYVSNAVQYTNSGRILLGCRRVEDTLRVEVWDTGPGIPEAEQARVFEEFHQVEYPARDRSRGLGLGLAIVERTAHLLGLEIGLRSAPGKGTMFWVTTPMALGSSPEAVTPSTEHQGNRVQSV